MKLRVINLSRRVNFLQSEGSPDSALRFGPDHSLVSFSARFTVLWPAPKARGGPEALWIPGLPRTLCGHRAAKPQNPQGIKTLTVTASGSSWQEEMRTDRVEHADGGEGAGRWSGLLTSWWQNYWTDWSEDGRQKYELRPGSSRVLMTVIRTNRNIMMSSRRAAEPNVPLRATTGLNQDPEAKLHADL